MHKKIIDHATLEQLKEFVDCAILQVKAKDVQLYTGLEMCLYKIVYGYHFSDWMLQKALDSLDNEDGTKGAHWTLDETTSVAAQYDIQFKDFNKYDWCYVLNMIYSDYFGAVPNDIPNYIKLARKFIQDKDADPGKAFKYYIAMAGIE